MKVIDLVNQMNLEVFTPDSGLENEVIGGYVCDLLSDVMGNASEGQAWITLQNHMNVVAVASLKDLSCVVFAKGVKPSQDLIERAAEEEIALLGSTDQTFELTGKIYQIL